MSDTGMSRTYMHGSHRPNRYSPLADSFFVLIIFAANSNPEDFCTHLLTIENAPLQVKQDMYYWLSFNMTVLTATTGVNMNNIQ